MKKKTLKKSLAGFVVVVVLLPVVSLMVAVSPALAYEEHQENGKTYIFGEITEDTVWTKEKSPYIVTGNITVAEDKILTVEPGAEIRFDGWYQINIKGTLNAVGEKDDYITFTSNWDNPYVGSWRGISLGNSSENNIIQYSIIEYADTGIYGNDIPDITLKNSILKNLNRGVEYCTGTVSHNYFVNANTAFEDPRECEITNNYISGSTRVFSCTSSETIIHSNNIVNYNPTNQNDSYLIHHCYYEDLDAVNNYWGTTDESYIDANIYDKNDDSWRGKVTYKPYANSLVTFNLIEPADDDLFENVSNPAETAFGWDPINGPGDILEYYELYIDGELKETDITGTDINYDISSLSDGYHSWYVVAVNSDGNSYRSNNVFGFNVNTHTPHTPIADPAGGWYYEDQSVTLSAAESNIIRYTLDGSDPITESLEYTSPISITAVEGTTVTLKAKAWDNDGNSSPIMTEKYQFDLTPPEDVIVDHQGGVYENSVTVSLSSEGSNEIRYTTNEIEPNELSALYTEPIYINKSTVLKAKAWDEVGNSSETITKVYNIVQPSYEPPVVTVDKLITDDTTPELTGTIDSDNATIAVIIAGNEYSATNNDNGTWTLADDTINELRIGIYDVEVRAHKNYGGWGYDNTTNELTIKSGEEKPSYAVAIDNQKDARPVSGINEADVVYEFPVEGSITRFMAIYNPNNELDPTMQIGPVRSARPYFARTASEHKAIYAHAGGIPDALHGLNNHNYSVYNLDALYGGSDYFWRDENRKMPHNLYTSIEKLNNFRDEFELGNGTFTQPWIFSDTPSSMEDIGYDQAEVEVKYANINYNVKWVYDDTDGVYYRQTYDNESRSYQDYIDINNNQVSTENIAVQYANTDPSTEIWETEGGALLCREGKCVNGRWKKDNLDSNVKFYLLSGEEFEFKTGKLWINVAEDITPPAPITNVTVENVSTKDELRLKINWVNPPDKDLAKIFICRSNIFTNDMWNCGLAENLKEVLDNSIEDNYITPDSTSVIDNYRLVEEATYYYKLYTADISGNYSELDYAEEASGIPLYNHGIRIDDITWIKNFGVTNDTYMDGWKVKFDITVNNPAENQLKFKMSDWTSGSNTIATIGNTKISLSNLDTEDDISNATSVGTEYSDMNPLTISDINPSMDKTQASFYIWTKLPTSTIAGSYHANYGIQTETLIQ